ncbi:MAG: response regulator [Balneola sp.]|nr:response regulator [Balneola sp.]
MNFKIRVVIFLGFVFVGNTTGLYSQQTTIPAYEYLSPDWFTPFSGMMELSNKQLLITGTGYTRIYDGGEWNKVDNLTGKNVLTYTEYQDEVWLGMDNDFGVIEETSKGIWEFVSMKKIFGDSIKIQNQIIGLYNLDEKLVLSTFHDKYIWDGVSVKALNEREILAEVLGKSVSEISSEYPRLLLNMTHVVDNKMYLEVDPFGYVVFDGTLFTKDPGFTDGLEGLILDITKFSNSSYWAVTLDGVFTKNAGNEKWKQFDFTFPEYDNSSFIISVKEIKDGKTLILSENYAYVLDVSNELMYSTKAMRELQLKESYLGSVITSDGTVWLIDDTGMLKFYPEMPFQTHEFPAYTQSGLGKMFVWDENNLVLSGFNSPIKLTAQDTIYYEPGIGAAIGVYSHKGQLYFPFEYQLLEYENEVKKSDSELPFRINSFIPVDDLEDTIFIGMEGGFGRLQRNENGEWGQELIVKDESYAVVVNLLPSGYNEWLGVTKGGIIFEVKKEGNSFLTVEVATLDKLFGVSEVIGFEIVDDKYTVLTSNEAFSSSIDNPSFWSIDKRFEIVFSNIIVEGIQVINERVYLFGFDSWSGKIWEYKGKNFSRIPVNAGSFFYGVASSPSNELMIAGSKNLMQSDTVEELKQWYQKQNIELIRWIKGSPESDSNEKISFSSSESNIQFRLGFTSNFYTQQHQFRIKINNDEWSDWQSDPEFSFTNLKSGTYSIKAEGIDGMGMLKKATPLTFRIAPPWYLSKVSIIFYGILILLMIWWLANQIASYRNRQLELRLKAEQLEELNKIDQMKTNLLMNISHELKTPLTLTLGPLELLKEKIDQAEEKWQKPYAMARRNGRRLQELVQQILDLARLDTNALSLNPEVLEISQFLRLIVESFESLTLQKKIKLTFEYNGDYFNAKIDRDKIQKVVTNLVSNAVKFTPEGGHIKVRLKRDNKYFILSVQDNGTGIEENRLDLIFDRFHTNHNKVIGSGEGIGIGLSITKEFVDLHNGKIHVESKIGSGTLFKVSIPVNTEDEQISKFVNKSEVSTVKLNEESNEQKLTTDKAHSYTKQDILVLEDNRDMQDYIISILEDEGFNVTLAQNGIDGKKKLALLKPKLILSDVMMPQMDGFEFAKYVRTVPEFRSIPLIMLTALSGENNRVHAFRIGVSDYVQKPFNKNELLVRIKNLLILTEERNQAREEKAETPDEMSAAVGYVEVLKQYVIENIKNLDITVEMLASEVNQSRSSLYRFLKISTGFTPAGFVKEIRLQQARTIIEEGKLKSISEVGNSVGFKTTAYFSKIYKERFGVSPKEKMI